MPSDGMGAGRAFLNDLGKLFFVICGLALLVVVIVVVGGLFGAGGYWLLMKADFSAILNSLFSLVGM